MPLIQLETTVHASIHLVFDLARSIDLHIISTPGTEEKAIAGRKTGLINAGETVTFRAKHLGFKQHLTSVISEMNNPFFFEDRLVKGPFSKMEHQHLFEIIHEYSEDHQNKTRMKDVFYYESPLGLLGKLADKMFLKRYLESLLIKRNSIIKQYAENQEKWMQVLNIY